MSRVLQLATTHASFPTVGLGTWQSSPGEVGAAVRVALLNAKYRHIDCASNYLNEHEIGNTLAKIFASGALQRNQVFITGKLNNPYHRREHVRNHLLKTLKDLQVDSLDLWLMHWPIAFKYVPFDMDKTGLDAYLGLSPNDGAKGKNIDHGVSIMETWQAMESLYEEGLVKAIGVSNFTCGLLHDLLSYAKIRPAVLQVESHPYLQQNALMTYCNENNIIFEAYSPLGAGGFISRNEPRLLEDPVLNQIGLNHGKTAAAVALRWAVQRGTVVIPKSVNIERITSNIDVYDWILSDDEMLAIQALDRNYHYLRPNEWYGVPLFSP